jgi:NitT/TauT family transport system permease protein
MATKNEGPSYEFPDGLIATVPILALFAVWQLTAMWVDNSLLLPKLSSVLVAFWTMGIEGELTRHVGASLFRMGIGFSLAVLTGVVVGLLIGMRNWAEFLFDPLITFGYPIPKIAIYPVLLIVFGLGHMPKVILVFLESLVPVIVGTYYGVENVDRDYIWSGRNLGASNREVFTDVVLPASLPYIFSGVRTAMPIAVVVTVVTEMISAYDGIGYLITYHSASLNLDKMFVGVMLAAIIGFTADRLLGRLRSRMLHWSESVDLDM